MSSAKPDLVLLRRGRPTIVVEVKGRVITPEFRAAVLEQLRSYSRHLRTEWAVLIDPQNAWIYRGRALQKPAAEIPTSRILEEADLGEVSTVGGAVLLLAAERWLKKISENTADSVEFLPQALVEAIRGADEYVSEFALA